jgi:L,D-transpeptidase ErfK/SrfK
MTFRGSGSGMIPVSVEIRNRREKLSGVLPLHRMKLRVLFLIASLLGSIGSSQAETFPLPSGEESVVGELQYTRSRVDDTLIDLAREFNLGYDQIVKANPEVNRWIPGKDGKIILPHRYILPSPARKGIVLNLAELRMYYYLPAKKGESPAVMTFPVSLGRMDWRTPLGATKVIRKDRDPAWHPPKSIREEHAREGDILPAVVPGGTPDNPLGRFAFRLGFPGYLIHGVDERKSYGIGMRVTHGCVRMYPEDIERLFDLVPVNTPVQIVDEPIKMGWLGDQLFLEVHQPLEEGEDENVAPLPRISTDRVLRFVAQHTPSGFWYDQEEIERIAEAGDGIPQAIGRGSRGVSMVPVVESARPKVFEPDQRSQTRSRIDREYEEALQRYSAPEKRGQRTREDEEEEADEDESFSREAREADRRGARARFSGSGRSARSYVEDRY